jgi:NAD(P)-dependent dehydrogenase (short-subunit alcohol dehydrogenase family)
LIAAYDAALERLGRIDVLVCNAAVVPSNYGAASDTPLEEYSNLMESNIVNNAALMIHASVGMKARRDGVIVAVSSTGGINPTHGAMPYGVSKAGLNFFVKGLGGELAPYNVRVNAVAPGLTRSWSMEQSVKANPEAMATFTKRVPLRRIIEPKEIAAGVILLATEGGKAMTGQIISMGAGDRGYGAPGAEDA